MDKAAADVSMRTAASFGDDFELSICVDCILTVE